MKVIRRNGKLEFEFDKVTPILSDNPTKEDINNFEIDAIMSQIESIKDIVACYLFHRYGLRIIKGVESDEQIEEAIKKNILLLNSNLEKLSEL